VRDKYLQSNGNKVIRIWSNELKDNLEGVMEEISNTLKE